MLDIEKYQTRPCIMPPSPLQEVQDLSRRYAAIKARFVEIATLAHTVGSPVVGTGIMISSRFNLRMIVMDEQSGLLRGELQIGPGEAQVSERWLVNGKVA